MTNAEPVSGGQWTMRWAALLAAACLMTGMGAGWLLREVHGSAETSRQPSSGVQREAPSSGQSATAALGQVESQAAPLLQKLQSDPANADLLVDLANLYYDAQQYSRAIEFYQRALAVRPSDASARTDMGTACWYLGDADRALDAFNRALLDQPNNPNTLFNRGIVKFQGKGDALGALADWKKLLAANPDYEARGKVEQLIAEAEKGTRTELQPR